MTQSQIVQALAEKCEVSKKVSQGFLTALPTTAISEVKKNGVFVLPGIGRLVRVDRKARMGRNPATGEAIKIAANKVVKFRIAKGRERFYRAAEESESLKRRTLDQGYGTSGSNPRALAAIDAEHNARPVSDGPISITKDRADASCSYLPVSNRPGLNRHFSYSGHK
jgi:DNA-binding protein HU-beta